MMNDTSEYRSSEGLVERLRRYHLGIYGSHAYGQKRRRMPAKWTFFDEIRMGTGYAQRRYGRDENGEYIVLPNMTEGRLDAWAMQVTKHRKHGKGWSITYEVKISRSDFKRESDYKRAAGMAVSNQFIYVTPRDLLKASEIPEDCGLIEVNALGHMKTIVRAPHRERDDLPMSFVMALSRRGSEAEHLQWIDNVYEPRQAAHDR